MPEELITDNGRQFISREFEEFLAQHGIRHRRTAFYHPQANGEVERFNRVVKDCLKTARADDTPPKEALRSMLAAYRATPQATTGRSPTELMCGRKMVLPLEVLKSKPRTHVHFTDPTPRVEKQQRKQKQYADEKRRAQPSQLSAGDWVRVRVQVRNSKLDKSWSEPKRIKQMIGESTALLEDGTRWNALQLRLDRDPHPEDDDDGWSELEPNQQPVPEAKQTAIKPVDPPVNRRPVRSHKPQSYLRDYELSIKG